MGNSPRSVRTALLLKNDDDDDEKKEADEGVAVSACLESASRRRARVERFRRQLRCSSAFDVLRSASPRERDDKALVVEAVRLSGHALSYASPRLRGDRECALAAVRQDGSSLQVCAAALQDDAGVVGAACRQDGRALCWASARLRRDPAIVVDAAAGCVEALRFCTAPHGSDLWRIIMVTCCRQNGLALAFANNNQMNNGNNGLLQVVLGVGERRRGGEDLRRPPPHPYLSSRRRTEAAKRRVKAPETHRLGRSRGRTARHRLPCGDPLLMRRKAATAPK